MTALPPALARLEPIGLAELDESVPLRVRSDRKHVLESDRLGELLDRLAPTHRALEVGGRRAFGYDSVYFDTEDLSTARAHVQRRRRRFKCRSRLYVESDACAFELKLKGGRGETVKHRIAYDPSDHGTLTPAAHAFLAEHFVEVPRLVAGLRTAYTRITLAGPGERTTIDLDLSFGAAWMRPGWAIVETKTTASGIADRELRRLGSRPVSLSKYVLGTGLTRMPTPPAETRRLARRYFAHA